MKRRALIQTALLAPSPTLGIPRYRLRASRLQGRVQDVHRRAAGVRLGQGRRDLRQPGARAHQRAASTSSSTPAPRWCRASRTASSRRCARASSTCCAARRSTGRARCARLGVFTLPFLLPDHKAYGCGAPATPRSWTSTSTSCARPAPSRSPWARPATAQISNSQAPDDQARRPQGHQGARRRQPDVRRDHERAWAPTPPS